MTMTLTDFLLARIAEDESDAHNTPTKEFRVVSERTAYADAITRHALRWEPVRVLAECEAKRRIVEMARGYGIGADAHPFWADPHGQNALNFEAVLEALALPYADHPDYDEEWSP